MEKTTHAHESEAKNSNWQPPTHSQTRQHGSQSSCNGCGACHKITSSTNASASLMLKSLDPGKKVCAARFLQRTYGNRYVQRLIQTKMDSPCLERCGSRAIQMKSSGCCGGCANHGKEEEEAPMQAKLAIGKPGDKYEQEADRVADTVMRMPEPEVQRQPEEEEEEEEIQMQAKELAGQITPLVQRQPMEEEEEELQARTTGGKPLAANASIESGINEKNGSGQLLSSDTRSFMERRFGADFVQVKVHTDSTAVQMNRELGSQAFTVGNDIYFNSGKYNPRTSSGKQLLAHELTHTIQQNQSVSGMINRACLPAASCPSTIPGSAGAFGASEAAVEASPRARRRGMTCTRATSTIHAGHARQLENILRAEDPSLLARIHGIFIDADLSSGTGAMVTNCNSWKSTALPAGCNPPALSSATKPCIFVHGRLNRQAYQFNRSSAPTIGGQSREDWRISTLQTLIHEAQHVVFDTSGRPEPPRAAATCPRSTVSSEVSELNAIMSEFPIVYRAIPAAPGPARTHAINRLNNWFNDAITNPYESLSGTLKAMRCTCNCPEVNAHVQDIFNLVTSSWTLSEKDAFNVELTKAKWDVPPVDLNWPLTP